MSGRSRPSPAFPPPSRPWTTTAVDLAIASRASGRPRIELQLKCTSGNVVRGERLVYPLPRKNYDDLRATDLLVPRLLIVVLVPEAEDEWLRHSTDELSLRRCGYWVSLRGASETKNTSTVTVELPLANVWDVPGLRRLMERAARKEPL